MPQPEYFVIIEGTSDGRHHSTRAWTESWSSLCWEFAKVKATRTAEQCDAMLCVGIRCWGHTLLMKKS